MADGPQGETDSKEGNKTVANSMNADGSREYKQDGDKPNMTGATSPSAHVAKEEANKSGEADGDKES